MRAPREVDSKQTKKTNCSIYGFQTNAIKTHGSRNNYSDGYFHKKLQNVDITT